jgi:hypothetical protein
MITLYDIDTGLSLIPLGEVKVDLDDLQLKLRKNYLFFTEL